LEDPTPLKSVAPVHMDLEVDRRRDPSVARQLIQALQIRIEAGVLPAGSRLPPSRTLARQLGVARYCVVEAYEELEAKGLVEGRGRNGTIVLPVCASQHMSKPSHPSMPTLLHRFSAATNTAPATRAAWMDWRPGSTRTRALPIEAWRQACRSAGHRLPPQGYGDARGERSLRAAIAGWIREQRMLNVEPERIIITQGAGHALRLIARTLIRSGDICAVEDPGYPGAARAFAQAGAVLQPVRVDSHGIVVDDLLRANTCPQLVHVTASHQYPAGGSMPGWRRQALVDFALARNVLLVENEYDGEFQDASVRHPPLLAGAPEHVLMVSTFAKTLSPALKLGFIVTTPKVANVLADHVEIHREHVSWPVQKTIEALLASGELERHLRRTQRHFQVMRDTIRYRLSALSDTVVLQGGDGGLHVVIAAHDRDMDRTMRARLKEQGVMFCEVRDFKANEEDASGLLFAYGHMECGDLDRALDELEATVDTLRKRTR
jgi:GntR family transcriptional regulator / MocR family aminotransferase